MAGVNHQTSVGVKAILKIKDLQHFSHHWLSTDNIAKIVRRVFNLPGSTKICINIILTN